MSLFFRAFFLFSFLCCILSNTYHRFNYFLCHFHAKFSVNAPFAFHRAMSSARSQSRLSYWYLPDHSLSLLFALIWLKRNLKFT